MPDTMFAPCSSLTVRRRLALPGVLVAMGLVGACQADLPDYPRGDPTQQVYPLTASHPGWQQPDCESCHGPAHDGMLGSDECSLCHGPNGAPQLGSSHPGWANTDCAGCHGTPAEHPTSLTTAGCVGCHGSNGTTASPPTLTAPQLVEAHLGWQRADCMTCHSDIGTHGGQYAPTSCGACHGSNGGPTRPANHYLEGCNECHADGPYPWNACTHEGYELLAPRACIFCHR